MGSDFNTKIGRTGRSVQVPIPSPKDDNFSRPRSREEKERRERDAWNYVEAQRAKDVGSKKAEQECRKAREQEHARKRDRGEEY